MLFCFICVFCCFVFWLLFVDMFVCFCFFMLWVSLGIWICKEMLGFSQLFRAAPIWICVLIACFFIVLDLFVVFFVFWG